MASNKGLGKGLGALLGESAMQPVNQQSPLLLPLQKIEPNRLQPRRNFDEEELSALADSIRQHGVIQPLTVRLLDSGYYQIIAGERRWRAARLAGLRRPDAHRRGAGLSAADRRIRAHAGAGRGPGQQIAPGGGKRDASTQPAGRASGSGGRGKAHCRTCPRDFIAQGKAAAA